MKKSILFIFAFTAASTIFCYKTPDNNGIIAYPSPFNPEKQVLSISYPNNVPSPVLDSASIEISDINGDTVFYSTYTLITLAFANPIIWNGRDEAGEFVNTGEYAIRVVTQNIQTGYYSSASIEILVQR